jgi:Fic family protein
MNDTKLNDRQNKILVILRRSGPQSRAALEYNLSSGSKPSRITVIRDLNHLIDLHLVTAEGQGRATVYTVPESHPVLNYLDMDEYFKRETTVRDVTTSFQATNIKNLHRLFTTEEQKLWEQSAVALHAGQKKLDAAIYQRELERFVIELSWKSSQIEGNTYDLLEAESLLTERVEANGHPHEEAVMIINHQKAFNVILRQKKNFKQLTFPTLTQLHDVLVADLHISTGLRDQPVRITGTRYSPPRGREEIDQHLRHIIAHINSVDYPPDKALIAACMLPYLQPFVDGNKRTARLLANALLLAHGYFPLSYRNVDVTEYRKAMIIFYEQQNLWHFKRIFVEQLEFAMHNYFQVS